MAEVKLFGFWPSPFSYRVIWALKLKGVNYEYIEEKLADKSALLLQYNPVHKKIPVLVHAGRPIAESNIILQYIEETWPENPLLPKDPYEKAQAMFWIKFPEDKLFMMQTMSFSFFVTTGDEQERAVKDCLETLGLVEEHGIGDNKFFAGDSIGLVDLSFGFMAYWLGIMEEAAGVKVLDPHLFPRLHRWTKNFKEVPVIRENLPEHDATLAYFKGRRETFITSGHKH